MWLKEPAKINDNIHFLGTHELCFYLVRGEEGLIVGSGMNHATPALEGQFRELGIGPGDVKYAVVTHSHFDHCGAVPYLRDRFPGIQILGTGAAAEALGKKKIADYNAKMNDVAAEQLGVADRCLAVAERADALAIDRVIGTGDSIDLGAGVKAQFYAVPGHSKCCVATYIPKFKALFPTDTTPHPIGEWTDLTYPSAQFDFATYVESLKRLNEFDVDIVGLDHHGVLLNEQAGEFLRMGLKRTLEFREQVLSWYAEMNDVDEVARVAAAEALQKVKLPFIKEDLMFIITRAMIRNIIAAG